MNFNLSNTEKCMVRATDGDVGRVEQCYFDDLTWTIRYISVRIDDHVPSERIVLLPLAAFGKPNWEKQVLPVNLTLSQVRSSPHIEVDDHISRQHEIALHQHYAWPGYWGINFYVPPIPEITSFLASTSAEADMRATSGEGIQKIDPHLRSIRDITKCRIIAQDGKVGRVDDFQIDETSWSIRYLMICTQYWRPKKRILLSPQWIKQVDWQDQQMFLNLSKNELKKCPEFDETKPINPDYEGKLRDHLKQPEVKEWVIFKIHAPPGSKVCVAGTFNNWDTTSIKLSKYSKGTYSAMVLLPPGKYEYKFIINGEWRNGPEGCEQVPNAFGTTNSILVVGPPVAQEVHIHTFPRFTESENQLLWSTKGVA